MLLDGTGQDNRDRNRDSTVVTLLVVLCRTEIRHIRLSYAFSVRTCLLLNFEIFAGYGLSLSGWERCYWEGQNKASRRGVTDGYLTRSESEWYVSEQAIFMDCLSWLPSTIVVVR